jgi:hypothetical protein
VFVCHNSGLFLLRSSLGYDFADSYYAEAVVAFYRIVEAVVARRLGIRKPEPKHVVQEARALGIVDEPDSQAGGRVSRSTPRKDLRCEPAHAPMKRLCSGCSGS